jgi:hypothetical protein
MRRVDVGHADSLFLSSWVGWTGYKKYSSPDVRNRRRRYEHEIYYQGGKAPGLFAKCDSHSGNCSAGSLLEGSL